MTPSHFPPIPPSAPIKANIPHPHSNSPTHTTKPYPKSQAAIHSSSQVIPQATTLPLSPQTLTSIPSSSNTGKTTMTTLSKPAMPRRYPHDIAPIHNFSNGANLSPRSHDAEQPFPHPTKNDPLKATAPNHYFITL
mmetsp:Transcript_8561/g.15010  ORF Transcript_8561/g.15010 Transcript_8561/m.15010 type:complete len:136 (+) Transcript_8561:79-486(+)